MVEQYLTSNPNNNSSRQPVFYNGQAYMAEEKGGKSYIKVGNRVITVDLSDPTWFLTFAHGDYSVKEKWEKLEADLEEQKQPHKDWMAYYTEVKENASQKWTHFRNGWKAACEQLYTANTLYEQTKKKYDSIMEGAKQKKCELSVDEKVHARHYEEQMGEFEGQKVKSSADKSYNKSKQITAGAEFQYACRSYADESQDVGFLNMQQIVCRHQQDA